MLRTISAWHLESMKVLLGLGKGETPASWVEPDEAEWLLGEDIVVECPDD